MFSSLYLRAVIFLSLITDEKVSWTSNIKLSRVIISIWLVVSRLNSPDFHCSFCEMALKKLNLIAMKQINPCRGSRLCHLYHIISHELDYFLNVGPIQPKLLTGVRPMCFEGYSNGQINGSLNVLGDAFNS